MNDRCFICANANDVVLEKHHIVPKRFGGRNTSDNLVMLCSNCHTAIEQMYTDERLRRIVENINDGGTVDLRDYEREARSFINDRLIQEPGAVTPSDDIYGAYAEYAESKDWPVRARSVIGSVLLCIDDVERTRPRANGTRVRAYRGIRLID